MHNWSWYGIRPGPLKGSCSVLFWRPSAAMLSKSESYTFQDVDWRRVWTCEVYWSCVHSESLVRNSYSHCKVLFATKQIFWHVWSQTRIAVTSKVNHPIKDTQKWSDFNGNLSNNPELLHFVYKTLKTSHQETPNLPTSPPATGWGRRCWVKLHHGKAAGSRPAPLRSSIRKREITWVRQLHNVCIKFASNMFTNMHLII